MTGELIERLAREAFERDEARAVDWIQTIPQRYRGDDVPALAWDDLDEVTRTRYREEARLVLASITGWSTGLVESGAEVHQGRRYEPLACHFCAPASAMPAIWDVEETSSGEHMTVCETHKLWAFS